MLLETKQLTKRFRNPGKGPGGVLAVSQANMQRLPAELSGGELQRAALARVLVLSPEILVLDEPTSMLDVITQAQMVRLLREYQAAHDTAYIFITHNRTLCDSLCSRVYHVEQGIVEEEGVKL